MLESLITSKTRIKLLLKFFLNSNTSAYLRSLTSEFGESSNAIRIELNRFEEAGLLTTHFVGNKKIFRANHDHPLFPDIQNLVRKNIGIDQIVDQVLSRCGNLYSAWITGDFAKGINNKTIDILLVGEELNQRDIEALIVKTEELIHRKIGFKIISPGECEKYIAKINTLLLWSKDPALVHSGI
jgi:hypothetical protein